MDIIPVNTALSTVDTGNIHFVHVCVCWGWGVDMLQNQVAVC
jgi:hypothetical protein